MTDYRVIEETDEGYQMAVHSSVVYRRPDGSFATESEFRESRKRSGYGSGGYGI